MTELLADIGFGHAGTSADHVHEGWGPTEPFHRWTVGAESRMRLPLSRPGPGCIVAINAAPWRDEACLPSQAVMMAINGRLAGTFQFNEHRSFAFALPEAVRNDAEIVLSICHLNSSTPRPAAGRDHAGSPLGLMVTSVRIFRLAHTAFAMRTRPAFLGRVSDGSLQTALEKAGCPAPGALVMGFESIGQNCEFGLIQRAFGADPLGLLRFASNVTHLLVDGLMARFAGIGDPQTTRIYVSDPPQPEFKVHEQRYYLWYSTGRTEAETTRAAILADQCRKLNFLRRKFVEDLRDGSKIHVLTRPEILTEAEALAVFCALQMEGPNALLWTVHGDPARTGQVDCLRPGFLRGHLGVVDERNYATPDAWLSVLANAYALARAYPVG